MRVCVFEVSFGVDFVDRSHISPPFIVVSGSVLASS